MTLESLFDIAALTSNWHIVDNSKETFDFHTIGYSKVKQMKGSENRFHDCSFFFISSIAITDHQWFSLLLLAFSYDLTDTSTALQI